MAEKVASIKLGLNVSRYQAGLGTIKSGTESAAKSMGGALKKGLADGMRGAMSSVKSGLGSLKNMIAGLGLFAGLPGMKDQIAKAVALEGKYRGLSFAIRAGTNASVDWKSIQSQVQSAALDTGNSTEELANSYSSLFKDIGDPEFAASAMRSVGMAARASGESVETLTNIAGTMNEKFGVSAGAMDDALAAVLSLGNSGGVGIQDMADKLGMVGASAKSAGLSGIDGFSKVAALLNLADGSTGNLEKGLAAVSGVIDTLGEKSLKNKALVKLGVDPKQVGDDAMSALESIMKRTGGNKDKLAVAFQGDQLKLLADMGQVYAGTFAATEGDVKTKTAAALAAYRASIEKAGKANVDGAALRKQSAGEMESAEAKLQMAMTKIEQAFSKPEITEAITKLMGALPQLADMVAKAVSFAVDSPLAAGGSVVAAMALKGALAEGGSSVASSLLSAFMGGAKGAAPALAAGIASGAPGLASSLAPLMGPVGLALGVGIAAFLAKATQDQQNAEAERSASAKSYTATVDSDRQNINSALKGSGIDVDPMAGMSPETARRLGKNVEEGDKFEAAAQKAKVLQVDDAMKQRMLAAWGPKGGSSAAPLPAVSVDPSAGRPQTMAIPGVNLAALLAQQELKVRIVNPKDISPSGGGLPPPALPGYMPRP